MLENKKKLSSITFSLHHAIQLSLSFAYCIQSKLNKIQNIKQKQKYIHTNVNKTNVSKY